MSTKKPTAGTAPKSPCEDGGGELVPISGHLNVLSSDTLTCRAFVCDANANVRVWLSSDLFVDQTGSSLIETTVPVPGPGTYVLRWGFLFEGDKWGIRLEVDVNSVTRFRFRKSDKSKHPFDHYFLGLLVS
ncbi:hypothetical protein PLCT1_01606 [Planctomycetaceae bacterium]|nr:hypothetical protein PLCT1_01606 [Planctomycetaceae bacterium]